MEIDPALIEQFIFLFKITIVLMFFGFAMTLWYVWTEMQLIKQAIAIIVAADSKLATKVAKLLKRPSLIKEFGEEEKK